MSRYLSDQVSDKINSFQGVQNLSALQASIRILPSLIAGGLVQLSTGLLIDRLSAFWLVFLALILSAGAPLLMAVVEPRWPYWYDAFFAQLLSPLSADILFTVGLLVVSDVFPTHTQAIAGAVFNTVTQFGTSIGLTVMAIISSSKTKSSNIPEKTSPDALMVGYRASFWAAFALMVVAILISAFGLRKIGKVGLKKD
jgi:MFS family permease